MSIFRPPGLDKAAPIVDGQGRITPYFQRFWQNLSFTAADGANQADDISALTLAVASKAPLANPTFTGTQTGTTAAQGTNTARLATTAFVHVEAVARATFSTWTAATGTASRATFATYAAPPISASPTQAEVQAIANHLEVLSQRMKALVDDLKV